MTYIRAMLKACALLAIMGGAYAACLLLWALLQLKFTGRIPGEY